MQEIAADGAMLSVQADHDNRGGAAARPRGARHHRRPQHPTSTVISGDTRAIEQIDAAITALGIKTKRLRVSHAFHSPHLDPMLTS